MAVDRKLLILAVFLVALGAAAGQSWTEDAQGFFSNIGDKIKAGSSKFAEKFKDMQKDFLEKFTDLPSKVKDKLGLTNYADINVTALVADLENNPEAYIVMNLEKMAQEMGPNKTAQLLKEGKDKMPVQIMRELELIQTRNLTVDEALDKLKDNIAECKSGDGGLKDPGCPLSTPELMVLQRKLGDPSTWTKDNVTKLGTLILMRPEALVSIKDKAAQEEALKIISNCISRTTADCPDGGTSLSAKKALITKTVGEPNKWTRDTLTELGGVIMLSNDDLEALPDPVILDFKTDLIQDNQARSDVTARLDALLKAENVSSMTAAEVKTWITTLGSLRDLVLPQHVSATARQDADLMKTLEDNVKAQAKRGEAPTKVMRDMLREKLNNKKAKDLTADEIKDLAPFMILASPGMIQRVEAVNMFNQEAITAIVETLPQAEGAPGLKAKLKSLTDASVKLATANGAVNINDIPDQLKPCLDAKYLESQSTSILKSIVEEANRLKIPLSVEQRLAIRKTLSVGDMPVEAVALKCMVPSSVLDTQGLTALQTFASSMPPGHPSLHLLEEELFGNGELTAEDIMENKRFLKIINPDRIKALSQEEAIKLMNELAKEPVEANMGTCRQLKAKLDTYMDESRGADEDDEIIEAMNIIEYEMYPACVIAAVGLSNLQKAPLPGKMALLQQMCAAPHFTTIPMKIRRMLIKDVKEGMPPRPEGELGVETLLKRMNCIGDMEPKEIEMLNDEAAELLFTMLNGAFLNNGIIPCMDEMQRNKIGELLEEVRGDPANWRDIRDIRCILHMMHSSKINRIPKDVLGSSVCEPMEECLEDAKDAWETMCMSEIGNAAFYKWERLKLETQDKQIQAALDTANEINARRRRKRAVDTNMCDIASLTDGNGISTTDLRNADKDDVASCLTSLTSEELEDKEKCQIIVDFMKEIAQNLTLLTADQIRDISYGWCKLTKEQVAELPKFTEETMGTFGMDLDLPNDVMIALLERILTDVRAADALTFEDITKLNNLMSVMSDEDIKKIDNDAFKDAMMTLGKLEDLPESVSVALAQKAVEAYGKPEDFTAATIAELGRLVGGLSPEQLKKVPSTAIAGLTVNGLKSISPDRIAVFEIAQIENLPAATAGAISPEQKAKFNEEMNEALKKAQGGIGSGVSGLRSESILGVLSFTLLLLFTQIFVL